MSEKTLPELKKELDELVNIYTGMPANIEMMKKASALNEQIRKLEKETAMKGEKTITQIREERIQMENEIKAAIEKFIENNPEFPPEIIDIRLEKVKNLSGKTIARSIEVKSTIKI